MMMKSGLALAVLAVTGFGRAGNAQAADFPLYKATPKAAITAFNWSGFYIGGNVGYGVARNPARHVFPATFSDETFAFMPKGVAGGGQIGFNWQATSHLVLGIEADWQASSQEDSQTCISICFIPGDYIRASQKLESFATVRGRLGWASGPMLFYATGGSAAGRVSTDTAKDFANFGVVQAGLSEQRSGWTIGGGIEAALAGNWTVKAEYLYLDLGTTTLDFSYFGQPGFVASDIRNHIARLGVNYRFGATAAATAADRPAINWAGPYVGGHVGYGVTPTRSREDFYFNGAYSSTETFNLGARGALGGAQIGYSWQAANLLFGVEADLQASAQGSGTICVQACIPGRYASYSQELPWFGTARVRSGYTNGATLFYVTGGLAYGSVETSTAMQIGVHTFPSHRFSETKVGWTIGGGIEAALAGNWSAKAEYLYVDLGKTTAAFSSNNGVIDIVMTNDINSHVFRLGVNYRLDTPIAAKF